MALGPDHCNNNLLYPIIDFDPDKSAIIEPKNVIQPMDVPKNCVICFFREVVEKIVSDHNAKCIYKLRSENGDHPIYEISYQGQRLVFFFPSVGAPLSAGLLEEAVALGMRNFIACGGCGVLDKAITVGEVLVPYAAIRAEGTSYHYLPPAEEVLMNAKALEAIELTLSENGIPYLLTKTWTTDALYRETRGKASRYKALGCQAVEMEAAAFMAVAEFRGVNFGQILYGGDAVIVEDWDPRGWTDRKDVRERLFWLSAEACLRLD